MASCPLCGRPASGLSVCHLATPSFRLKCSHRLPHYENLGENLFYVQNCIFSASHSDSSPPLPVQIPDSEPGQTRDPRICQVSLLWWNRLKFFLSTLGRMASWLGIKMCQSLNSFRNPPRRRQSNRELSLSAGCNGFYLYRHCLALLP